MFCEKCGTELPDDSHFCTACGEPVKTVTEESISEKKEDVVVETKEEEIQPTREEPKEQETPQEEIREEHIPDNNTSEADSRTYDKLCELEKLFKERIAYDEHKNELFDKLYEDKKRYENDVIATITDPILIDIIHVIEEIRAQIAKLPDEATPENYEKLKRKFGDIPQRLEDVLYEYDVEPYEVSGDVPDLKQQKVVQAIDTEDSALTGKVAARLNCGYKKGNKVIKSERINVYKSNKEGK